MFGFFYTEADRFFGTTQWDGIDHPIYANGVFMRIMISRNATNTKMGFGQWFPDCRGPEWSEGDEIRRDFPRPSKRRT